MSNLSPRISSFFLSTTRQGETELSPTHGEDIDFTRLQMEEVQQFPDEGG